MVTGVQELPTTKQEDPGIRPARLGPLRGAVWVVKEGIEVPASFFFNVFTRPHTVVPFEWAVTLDEIVGAGLLVMDESFLGEKLKEYLLAKVGNAETLLVAHYDVFEGLIRDGRSRLVLEAIEKVFFSMISVPYRFSKMLAIRLTAMPPDNFRPPVAKEDAAA